MKRPHKWKFRRNAKGKWRWKRTASNGRIVEASTESYSRVKDCVANARLAGWNSSFPTTGLPANYMQQSV